MFMYLIMLVCILLGVALFTLLERKILGYIHKRLGPNKNLFIGIFQPFNDLIKLFSKSDYKFKSNNLILFSLPPLIMVMNIFLMWLFFYHWGSNLNNKYFIIVMMCINGVGSLFFLMPGWSSGSFYSSIGSFRTSAQVISYEGLFFFCLFIFLMYSMDYSINVFMYVSNYTMIFYSIFFMIFLWMCSIMAESNRSPFDFIEGESELVSGFNTEYGGGLFSLIFLSEYMSMLFLSYFSSLLLFGFHFFSFLITFFFLFFYVWVRVSFPRLRYDKLMIMSWKSLMVLVTSMLFLYYYLIFF